MTQLQRVAGRGQGPRASRRPSSSSTTRSSPGRAWVPSPPPTNPHKVIASYANDMELVVFNGHVHTTEMYDVDGVKYLMLGGGGAEQDPILPGRTSIKTLPADYPPDLYWKGQPPEEEYNYVLVDVKPGEKTKFTLNRFRPESAEPFASVELFK